jgi:glutamate N-acetyltransferase/amino-acid N-acetyltransferase
MGHGRASDAFAASAVQGEGQPSRACRRARARPPPDAPLDETAPARKTGAALSQRRLMAKPVPVSPLAPTAYPPLPGVPGVRFASGEAGVRYKGRTDVTLVVMDEGADVAGVFTKSLCPSAPVDWCRANLAGGRARAVVVNSGNANAFTGHVGAKAVATTAEICARATGAKPSEIFIASTGVIGEPLDASKFEGVLDHLAAQARAGTMLDAAKAIMTTDTFPKVATASATIGGVEVTIAGMAKGAGMIAPDMATMLAFVFTDADVAAPALQALLSKSVETSFNAITVDSDTSTSDTLMLFATGKARERGAPRVDNPDDPRLADFARALDHLLVNLAQQVARDGEGARKFVAVTVEGAVSDASAKKVAMAIANSPLVKTALAGEDANWGRVVMAVGKAGEPAERDKLAIWFGPHCLAHDGLRDPAYDEAKASAYMKNPQIDIRVDLNLGSGRFTVWTCDLTKAYVEINGDYRS